MVVLKGGYPEQIHFLTTQRGQETVGKLAELIVTSPWKIPRSFIEDLAYKDSMKSDGDGYSLYDRYHFWNRVGLAREFGIAVTSFRGLGDHGSCDCDFDLVPQEILDQLCQKQHEEKPLIVRWNDENYVVVDVNRRYFKEREGVGDGDRPLGFPVLIHERELNHVSLAPVRYFDMTR